MTDNMKPPPAAGETIELCVENGSTMRRIRDRSGIIRQAVQARRAEAEVRRRPPRHEAFPQARLAAPSANERLSPEKAPPNCRPRPMPRAAPARHGIPERAPLKLGGEYADWRRGPEIGGPNRSRFGDESPAPATAPRRDCRRGTITIKKLGGGGSKPRVTRKS